MSRILSVSLVCVVVMLASPVFGQAPVDASRWTIYVANDNCPDYTWGLTEEQTRQAFADIVKGHLDEMKRTDHQPPASRDRYNMAVTLEALCFVERYPDRKEELIRRIKEGRMFMSPYLCNSLWGLQSAEGAIRTFYPARRLEQEWGIPIDCAHHIELPSLPWGVATILAGCGIRSLSVPFLSFESTFRSLKNPPLFLHEGPDGSRVRVVMDRWACAKASYWQGASVLKKPESIDKNWLPHYAGLGKAYPLRAILASGTHGDIKPHSHQQVRGFAEAIIQYNARPGTHATLVNATFPQFWQAVDEVQSRTPFLPTVRGSFGHSWELWPVSLAKYAADMREGERTFLAAESLLAVAAHGRNQIHADTRADRERAEWYWAMLSDHAWNGTSKKNRLHNADLRRDWARELNSMSQSLLERGWSAVGLRPDSREVTLFNSLSLPRTGLVRIAAPENANTVVDQGRDIPCQIVLEDGRRVLYFVGPEVPGFGFRQLQFSAEAKPATKATNSITTPTRLESPYYRVVPDLETGGIASLIHKATGTELVVSGEGRGLCQTVYFDGKEHTLADVTSEVVAQGPVLARLRLCGTAAGIEVTNFVTVYTELDQVDFDLRIKKPTSTEQQRLCQVFPVLSDGAKLRTTTAGAIVRPYPKPEGDLRPGADTRRFAVQEFVNVSSENISITIAPLDAFALRLDLEPISIEALGNDHNYRQVTKDQHGVTDFRFRYSLRAKAGGYCGPDAIAFGRSAATPLLAAMGRLGDRQATLPVVTVDPARAVATCFKPADGDASGGCILRLWEVAGQPGPLSIGLNGYGKAVGTDLLERDGKELQIVNDRLTIDLKAHGYSAVRLLR